MTNYLIFVIKAFLSDIDDIYRDILLAHNIDVLRHIGVCPT